MPLPNSPTAPGAGNPLPNSILVDMIANDSYLDTKINAQIQIAGASFHPSATNGSAYGTFVTATNANNFRPMDFSNSGGKLYCEYMLELPADYDGGTITFHVNWLCQNASTDSAVFGLQAVAYTNDGALDAAFGTAQEVTDANLANGDLNQSAESSAITIAGTPAAGKIALFRFYRDSGNGSDVLAATAQVLNVVITYTRL